MPLFPAPGWSENYAQHCSSLTEQKDWVMTSKMHGSYNLGMSDGLRATELSPQFSYLNLGWATEMQSNATAARFSFLSILHWQSWFGNTWKTHDDLEIIIVLKGSINIPFSGKNNGIKGTQGSTSLAKIVPRHTVVLVAFLSINILLFNI